MVRLSRPESSENLTSGSPRPRCLHLGEALRLGVGRRGVEQKHKLPFSPEFFQQKHTISKQNHKTNLNQLKTHVLKS